MEEKIINNLQDQINIDVLIQSIVHKKGHSERGYKYQYDLWILKSGQMEITYENKTTILNERDLFLIYPNVVYESKVLSNSMELIFCRFDCLIGQSNNVLQYFPFSGPFLVENHKSTSLEKTVNDFIDTFENRYDAFLSLYRRKQYFNIVIACLMERVISNIGNDSIRSYKLDKINRIMPAIDYIHKEYFNNIKVLRLARLVSMSEKYFITYFKNVLGVTPLQYQLNLRMQSAVKFLTKERYTIKEIADMLGYCDAYHFSAAFKKYYGISPSRYLVDGKSL